MRPPKPTAPSEDPVVLTANVARLAAADSSFCRFVTRSLGIYSNGGSGVEGIEVRNGSRLFSTFTQEGFPGIALVREPRPRGRTTVAMVSDY